MATGARPLRHGSPLRVPWYPEGHSSSPVLSSLQRSKPRSQPSVLLLSILRAASTSSRPLPAFSVAPGWARLPTRPWLAQTLKAPVSAVR
ncbi:hypothetical protein NDU88_004340 [Pleurodeles waltl]|uniref:Uncharacterized protein n=1 Tax=Pleurodeles waltl TaxID=8319 RepID=A0AAV7UF20_PLEWA|nr:hypothetical protein NDU88_004340 [Pleurodeles waltl]